MKIVIINICAHDKACKERYSAITSHGWSFFFLNRLCLVTDLYMLRVLSIKINNVGKNKQIYY